MAGGEIPPADQPWPEVGEVIIDALLGTRLKAAPRNPYRELIIAANRHPASVFTLDIPSGLDADTGATPGEVICAAHTATFVALKPGLLTGKAGRVTGRLHYDDLGLREWVNRKTPLLTRLSAAQLPRWFPPRDPCAHKGDNGLRLNGNVGDIERDRLHSARQLVRRYGGVVVLKGAGTLLAAEDGAGADVGNAGMASGEWGMSCPV